MRIFANYLLLMLSASGAVALAASYNTNDNVTDAYVTQQTNDTSYVSSVPHGTISSGNKYIQSTILVPATRGAIKFSIARIAGQNQGTGKQLIAVSNFSRGGSGTDTLINPSNSIGYKSITTTSAILDGSGMCQFSLYYCTTQTFATTDCSGPPNTGAHFYGDTLSYGSTAKSINAVGNSALGFGNSKSLCYLTGN